MNVPSIKCLKFRIKSASDRLDSNRDIKQIKIYRIVWSDSELYQLSNGISRHFLDDQHPTLRWCPRRSIYGKCEYFSHKDFNSFLQQAFKRLGTTKHFIHLHPTHVKVLASIFNFVNKTLTIFRRSSRFISILFAAIVSGETKWFSFWQQTP